MSETALLPTMKKRTTAFGRLRRNPLGMISAGVLLIIVLVAVFAPLLMPHDPSKPLLDQINSAPNEVYWLGGDGSGRDILSRLVDATRPTLLGTVAVAVVALVIGIGGGVIAGYVGGVVDLGLAWIFSAVLAVPAIIILIALYSVIGPNLFVTMALFGLLISPILFRLVRTMVMAVRRELYVDAARVSGLSESRIMVRHVLLAVRAPVIVTCAGAVGAGIMIQAGLAFLGLGTPDQATWGGMLQDAFLNIYRAPLNILWPGVVIGLTTAALALLANALRDALEDTGDDSAPARKARSGAAPHRHVEAAAFEDESAGSAPDPEAILSIRDLSVGYPDADGEYSVVVDHVSLDIRPGDVLGLVGESGSGKSQTSLAILGLLPEKAEILSGTIHYEGVPLLTQSERQLTALRGRRIAYVPQEPMSNLDPSFSIGYQVATPMRRRLGLTKKDAEARALQLLERVGIADPARTMTSFPHQISGGMAQRVLIACAVSCDPDLIIADEPTTALDVTVQAEILDLLRDLQNERGLALLFVTHDLGVVADICDRVAVMYQGRIVETADIDDLFDAPQHDYTKRLLAAAIDDEADVAVVSERASHTDDADGAPDRGPRTDDVLVAEGAGRRMETTR